MSVVAVWSVGLVVGAVATGIVAFAATRVATRRTAIWSHKMIAAFGLGRLLSPRRPLSPGPDKPDGSPRGPDSLEGALFPRSDSPPRPFFARISGAEDPAPARSKKGAQEKKVRT